MGRTLYLTFELRCRTLVSSWISGSFRGNCKILTPKSLCVKISEHLKAERPVCFEKFSSSSDQQRVISVPQWDVNVALKE